jgi:tetratricopeptide (TPR) repeat protein/serine/threonine protein kinase
MNDPHDLNQTVDIPSVPADSLDAGLAAGFAAPRSSLGDMRPPRLKEAESESAHVVQPKSDAMPPPEQTGDRYQLQGEIARGGMGAVLRGRDVDLGRDLAVKVLLEKHAHRPEVARRFIEEAQIGGQLQHPGVVPVYDIGHFGERPFFTMKLVKGKTLAALLSEREVGHVSNVPDDDLARWKRAPQDLPRFLAIALQVCQTLAYAHAKGVIHRDLKPANIMVGAFGEVQVMDWGLAKVLAEGGVADEEMASRERERPEDVTTIRTARSSGSTGSFGSDTEAGALLGTPAYMPPEQANGDVAHLDRQADVFGLGAIVCEILTGKPPYVGRSSEEVRRKAANGDLADATARLDACGADSELIALTKGCLAAEAIDRPKDAQEVTDRLSAYLNGVQERLQTAERERAVALAREAEQRKRRKVQLALAAAVLGLMLGGGAFAWWRNEETQAARERDARNAEAVAALLCQAEEALGAGDAAKAAVALEAARKRSAEGGADEHAQRLGRLDADLSLLRDLDQIDQFRWTWTDNKFADRAIVAKRTRAALTRFGADPNATPAADVAARVSTSKVQERIVSALDRLLRQEKAGAVRSLLRQVDADPYRDAIRDAVLAHDRKKLVELAGRKTALEQPPGFAAFLGESDAIPVDRRRELLQAAVSRRPANVDLLMTLGTSYSTKPHDWVNERLRWFQAAVAAAPANVAALNDLGNLLKHKGDVDGAIACWRKAIEVDPTCANAHNNLGDELRERGQLDEAIRHLEEAIRLLRKDAALDPNQAIAHYNLGVALAGRGQMDEAIACFKKAIELDPKDAGAHSCLGASLSNHQHDYDAAIACFKTAIKLNPEDAVTHFNLGNALVAKDQVDAAIACWRRAVELDPKHAVAHSNLGVAAYEKGKVDEAIACWRKAVELDPKDAASHYRLGIALGQKGQLGAAIVSYRTAIEAQPNIAEPHCNLGSALQEQGRFTESLAAYKRGHELGMKQPGWGYPSGEWVRNAERMVAMESKLPAFLKGEFQPKDSAERFGLAGVCRGKKLLATAARVYADAFALEPRQADDLKAAHRYHAACCAALAGAGQGEDAAKLDDLEKARLRKQALDWLRADLAQRNKQLKSGQPAQRTTEQNQLRQWQQDRDLSGVRDTAALAKLPPEERAHYERLWADVAALVKNAEKANQEQPSAEAGKQVLQPEDGKNVADKQVAHQSDEEAAKVKLATEYLKAGKKRQALPLLVEIWNMKKARLGPEHPDTLASMNRLGVVYWELGQLDKSVPLFEKLLKIREAKLGRDDPETLQAAANLGVNYKDAGKLKEAIALLEEALGAARKHPQLGWVVNPALDAYSRAGENAKVVSLIQEVLPAARKRLPPDSPQLSGLLAQGGMALLNLKKWAEAEPLLRECLTIREKTQPDVWATFNAKSMLGGVLLGQKKYADAEPLLLAGYEGMKKREATIPPQGRPRLIEAALRLVQLYEALGKQDEVARWSREREALEAPAKDSKKKNAKERKP